MDPKRSSVQSSLPPLDWKVIRDTALQLERLLCNADQLERRYHLVIKDEALERLGERADQVQPKSVLDRLISKFRPANPFSQTAQLIDEGATPVLRIRYSITDKTKLDELITDIEKLVSKLWQYVGEIQQRMMAAGMRYLLREALTRASAKDDIDELQALLNATYQHQPSTEDKSLCALPDLKQKRLDLSLDVTNEENSEHQVSTNRQNLPPSTRRIKGPEVTAVKGISYNRELASYKSRSVLVEWKGITAGLEEKLEWRVKALGTLLNQTTPDVLGSLSCKGAFKDIGKNRYGFVFDLPAGAMIEPETPVKSLFDMLSNQPPSFEERIHVARQLSRSVRQLHTVGWLHKALRSENVLFCPSASKAEEKGPYLAGFGYARAADPTQFSEIPPAMPESDIYCHPDLLGGETKLFRKKYDVFALGTVLIEIGLWKTLSAVLLAHAGFPETDSALLFKTIPKRTSMFSEEGEGSILHELRLKCPRTFCEAVSICIQGQIPRDEDDDDGEVSLELQQRVVELLET